MRQCKYLHLPVCTIQTGKYKYLQCVQLSRKTFRDHPNAVSDAQTDVQSQCFRIHCLMNMGNMMNCAVKFITSSDQP